MATFPSPRPSLLADRRGVTAIEFAIAAPIVILLLMTVFEMGLILTGGVFLEAGARAAGRFGITGAARIGETRETTIRNIITGHVCPSALPSATSDLCFWKAEGAIPGLVVLPRAYSDPRNLGLPEPFADLPPENGHYDAGETYVDVNGNGQWDSDMGVATAGGANDIVIYEVSMKQAIATPLLRTAVGDAVFTHRTRIVVRNEPF